MFKKELLVGVSETNVTDLPVRVFQRITSQCLRNVTDLPVGGEGGGGGGHRITSRGG